MICSMLTRVSEPAAPVTVLVAKLMVTAPEARPYVRLIIERLFPSLPVLSHVEIARGVEVETLGTIS